MKAADSSTDITLRRKLRAAIGNARRDVLALWIAARDPRTPRTAKLLAGFVAAYALSPIDLIPDFIPVLGYLDDLVIVPLGIIAAIALIPPDLMREFRQEAERRLDRPASRLGAAIVVVAWALLTVSLGWLVLSLAGRAL